MNDDIVKIVTGFYEKVASHGPSEAADETFADSFRLIAGKIEIDRNAFVVFLTRLYSAIPDLTHQLSDIQTRGEVVQLTDQFVGTFTGEWDASSLGLGMIPPHGKAFQMAPSRFEITVRNGKITRWHDTTVPSASSGLIGFLKALGSGLPISGS